MNVFNLYSDGTISYEEMIVLYIILENKSLSIQSISNRLSSHIDIKIVIETLYNKSYIQIDWNNNKINLSPTFTNNNILDNTLNEVEVDENKDLTIRDIDRIRVIINRELKPYELSQVQSWYTKYTVDQIIEAIYKASLKNIDNFNYIEKILYNEEERILPNSKEKSEGTEKVKKNFDFFKRH